VTPVEELLSLCTTRGLMITTAESCTGGLVAAALTDVAGSSRAFERGYITYADSAKIDMLGVSADTLGEFGAVSEQVARQMADGARLRAGADIAVAVSGIAGPGGSDFKPEGRVCFAIATRGGRTRAETVEFGPLGRAQVRAKARDHALLGLLEAARRL
jgi:nicotinamide-nucleotide amidase